MKQQDPNYQMVTLGMDLTQLGGLDLNCPEPEIHHTFLSPWLDKWDESTKFKVPACYLQTHHSHSHSQNASPRSPRNRTELGDDGDRELALKFVPRYKDSTLFYIFYSAVNDRMQAMAARELYKRQWAYHKALQLWLYGLGNNGNNGNHSNSNGQSKVHYAPDSVQFFDVEAWKRKHFVKRFMPRYAERELKEKVKFLNTQKKRMLSQQQLDVSLKACQEEYAKNRH